MKERIMNVNTIAEKFPDNHVRGNTLPLEKNFSVISGEPNPVRRDFDDLVSDESVV